MELGDQDGKLGAGDMIDKAERQPARCFGKLGHGALMRGKEVARGEGKKTAPFVPRG